MKFTIETVLQAPLEEVFAAITEDEKIKEWNDMFVENNYQLEELRDLNEPGTKYTSVLKVGKKKTVSYEGELVEYEFPHRTVVRAKTKEGVTTATYECISTGKRSTRMIFHLKLQSKNTYYKIMAQLVGWINKLLHKAQFEALKEYLEDK